MIWKKSRHYQLDWVWAQWRNWRRDREASRLPGKLNVKTGPPLADITIFSNILVFTGLFFCVFRTVFVFLASVDIHDIQIHYHFLTFFLSVG